MTVLEKFRLDGQVAVVTGASSGLGEAFAIALAQAGADVVLGARRLDRLRRVEERVREAGGRVTSVPTDVTKPADCAALVDAALRSFDKLDVLVNNAGVGNAVPALTETPEEFQQVLDVNLGGVFFTAQAAARVMPPGSSIINISSIAALTSFGLPQAAYSASKAAVHGLTRDLAQQWTGRRGIRVNAIAPGFVETEMTMATFTDGNFGPQADLVPAGRGGRPDEIASAVVYLASDASSYVSGHLLVVDGGRCIF